MTAWAMVDAPHRLFGVAGDTIRRSRTQLVDDLRTLAPTLRQLTDAGANLPTALRILLTCPFPDCAGHVVTGDYLTVNAHLDLDLDKLVANLANSPQPLSARPSPRRIGHPGRAAGRWPSCAILSTVDRPVTSAVRGVDVDLSRTPAGWRLGAVRSAG